MDRRIHAKARRLRRLEKHFRHARVAVFARLAGAWAALACTALCGCSRAPTPRVLFAEFLDDVIPDGRATPDETIRIALDEPLPPGLQRERIRVRSLPAARWSAKVEAATDSHALLVRILTGSPDFEFRGIHGRDPEATGIEVDFGDGRPQVADLQLSDSLPVLERVVWHDRGEPRGNRVVDEGDVLRLIFDRPVKLESDPNEALSVRCPQDIVLRKRGIDRLDDGQIPAFLAPAPREEEAEVRLVLGSNPYLVPATDRLAPDASSTFAPSGLALNGTRLLPMRKIVDRRGGRGAISVRELDIECEEELELPRPLEGLRFPEPGHRALHSLTPIAGGRAVLAGGAAASSRQPLDQILLFDPFLWQEERGSAFILLEAKLRRPSYHHTATLLPGADRVFHTADDLIVLAGGTDGLRAHADLTVIRLREDGGLDVEHLVTSLKVPRAEHAAAALPGNRVLIDGGKTFGPEGASGLVGCAEVIAIDPNSRPARVTAHVAFRSVARMRHTLTLLAPAANGETFVLAYGGYGDPRRHELGRALLGEEPTDFSSRDLFFPTDDGAVLASAALLAPDSPKSSIWRLPCSFELPLLRWGHTAVPLRGVPPTTQSSEETLGCEAALIVGGTSRHLLYGFDGGSYLWDIPRDTYFRKPKPSDAACALLFRFRKEDPASSAFSVLPYPEPDEALAGDRLFAQAVEVPGGAVWILGGESPRGAGANEAYASGQVFSKDTERLAQLAIPLWARRTRHQAYVVDMAGTQSVFLLGGIPGGTELPPDFPAVEEVPLRR